MSRCLPVTSHARAVAHPRAAPGRPRLVEEAPGRVVPVEAAPARPPAQPRRRRERDERDEGLAGQGPLGGRARRAEAGQPLDVAEALLDGVLVVAGRQRLEGPHDLVRERGEVSRAGRGRRDGAVPAHRPAAHDPEALVAVAPVGPGAPAGGELGGAGARRRPRAPARPRPPWRRRRRGTRGCAAWPRRRRPCAAASPRGPTRARPPCRTARSPGRGSPSPRAPRRARRRRPRTAPATSACRRHALPASRGSPAGAARGPRRGPAGPGPAPPSATMPTWCRRTAGALPVPPRQGVAGGGDARLVGHGVGRRARAAGPPPGGGRRGRRPGRPVGHDLAGPWVDVPDQPAPAVARPPPPWVPPRLGLARARGARAPVGLTHRGHASPSRRQGTASCTM